MRRSVFSSIFPLSKSLQSFFHPFFSQYLFTSLVFWYNIFYSQFSLLLLYSTLLSSTLLYSTLLYSNLLYSPLLYSLLYSLHPVPSLIQLCTSQNKTDLECYYEPLGKCTFQDALASEDGKQVHIDSIPHVGNIPHGEEDNFSQKYISKRHNLLCCHHENMITSCFSLLIVASCHRFFYYAAISLLFHWLLEPLCTFDLSQVLTHQIKNK